MAECIVYTIDRGFTGELIYRHFYGMSWKLVLGIGAGPNVVECTHIVNPA